MKPIYVIIIVVLVGAGAFFGGMEYQKKQTPQFGFRNAQIGGPNASGRGQFQQRMMQGVRPINGEIIAQDDKSITVKMQDGSTKIVLISETTAINKAEQGAKSDLTVGTKVAAFGKENSDGSITAQNVQLNPGDRFMIRQDTPAQK